MQNQSSITSESGAFLVDSHQASGPRLASRLVLPVRIVRIVDIRCPLHHSNQDNSKHRNSCRTKRKASFYTCTVAHPHSCTKLGSSNCLQCPGSHHLEVPLASALVQSFACTPSWTMVCSSTHVPTTATSDTCNSNATKILGEPSYCTPCYDKVSTLIGLSGQPNAFFYVLAAGRSPDAS